VAIIGALWLILARRNGTPSGTPLTPQVTLATVRAGSVAETISAGGRVGSPAGTQTKLAFAVPGSVASVDVRLGEHVETGETLARLDPTSYSLAAQQAGAEANAAAKGAALASIDRISVKLHADEAELARQQLLYGAGIVALRDVQAARSTLAADRAESQSAVAQLAQAQAQARAATLHAASASFDVTRTALRSPATGTVVGIFVQPGQTVDPTIAAIAIASQNQGLATLEVPVSELHRIATGDPVRMRSSGGEWQGRVAGIAPSADPATGLAVVSVSGVPAGTAAGTPLDATIVVGEARGLVIPVSAVIEDPQTGAQIVFVRTLDQSGTPHFAARNVAVDIRDSRVARVTAGLRAGEQIAVQGAVDLLAQPQ
jgi:RND family efflux transporter MFP subunit